MTEYAKLVISVDSRPVAKADGDLNKLTLTAGKTERATEGLGSAFRRLAGPLAAVISARQIAQAADTYTTLTNRLRLVTDSSEELAAAQGAVFDIAQQTRQPLDATAELYQRVAQNADQLGLSLSEVAGITESVNQLVALSGSSSQAAEAGIRQFAQALGAGALRGDELISVIENVPALAKAIADGLGVTIGELRQLGADGALTAEAVAQAIQKTSAATADSFSQMQATGGQALTALGNSLTQAIGQLDAATGSSAAFANGILELSRLIDSGVLTDPLIESFAIWSASFDAASADIEGLGADLDFLGQQGQSAADFIGTAFKQMPANLRAAVQIATVEVASFFDRVGRRAAGAAAELVAYVKGGSEAAARVAQIAAQDLQNVENARQESIDGILAEREAIIQAGEAAKQRFAEERKAREEAKAQREAELASLREGLQGRQITLGGAGATEKQAKEAERAAQRLSDLYANNEQQLARQVALFGQTSEAARIRYEVENGELSKLNEQQQLRLIGLAEEIDRLEQIAKEREEEEATEAYTAALRDQIMARQNAIDIEVEAIGIGEQRAEVLRELNALEFEYAKRLEELARAQGTSAALSAEAYQQRVEALREAMEEEIRIVEEGERRKEDARKNAGAGARKALEDYIADANDLAKQTETLTRNALRETEDAFVEFAKTGKLSFKDLANSILDDLIRIGARQVTASLASGLLGAFGGAAPGVGGAGATGGGLADIFAGFFDRGGPIPVGKFGIVGENGPEIVRGPANVTSREQTAKQLGSSLSIGQMVFPNVTNAKEAREASGVAARNLAKLMGGVGRYA